MKILEFRETLESCKSKVQAEETMIRVRGIRDGILNSITAAFEEQDLDVIRPLIDRLKFYETVLEVAEARYESFIH